MSMMTTYTLTRTIDDVEDAYTSVTVTDRDAINCAYLLASAFNRISRNFTLGFIMAVVDTQNGIVHFDGKTEELKKPEPWSTERTFTFNATGVDTDTILSILDADGMPKFTTRGKFTTLADVATDDEVLSKASEALAKAGAGAVSRTVLEEAYVELQAVKAVLEDAGVETIPADRGVKDMSSIIGARDNQIAELVQERVNREQANRSAVVEMVDYVKKAHAKLDRIDPAGDREDLQGRMRGMLDVLAKFLVVTGEADYDERHAVARRLCEIKD
jgi:hypothetical protein